MLSEEIRIQKLLLLNLLLLYLESLELVLALDQANYFQEVQHIRLNYKRRVKLLNQRPGNTLMMGLRTRVRRKWRSAKRCTSTQAVMLDCMGV